MWGRPAARCASRRMDPQCKAQPVPGNEGKEPLQLETEQLTERDQGLARQRRRIDVAPTETIELVRRESQDPRDSCQGLGVARQHALQDLAQPITCAWAASFEELSGTLADTADLVGISPEGIERAFVECCHVSPSGASTFTEIALASGLLQAVH